MADPPEKQPHSRSGNGWLIGFGALFAGYVLGQSSTPATQQRTYSSPSPPAVLTTTADTSGDDSTVDGAINEITDAAGDDSPSTSDQAASAYTPSTASQDADDWPGVEVASASDDADESAVETPAAAPATTVASSEPARSVPGYQTPYSYAPPSVGYSSSSSKCEGLGCYGQISKVTGLPRTTYVRGYTRRDGTYVQPHYRSRRR